MQKITAHVLVKNEENFIWFAIMSVIDFVDQILVFDTGSSDKTVEIIKKIKSQKIVFEEKGEANLKKYICLRQELIERTQTSWFLQLDGDEVWPKDSILALIKLIENASSNIIGIVNRTRNCVGDIYHYLPEEAGNYEFFGEKGHFNIRAIKKTPDLKVELAPPFNAYTETYINKNGPIPKQEENLLFLDKYLWHFTHLPRSSFDNHKKRKWELGIRISSEIKFPEVFYLKRPISVPNPWRKMKKIDLIKAIIQTPFKKIKRRFKF